MQAGSFIDLIPSSEPQLGDVKIASVPEVVADLQTATLLADRVIDFDYERGEFTIAERNR